MRVEQGTVSSTVLDKNEVSDQPTSFFRGKIQLYFAAIVE